MEEYYMDEKWKLSSKDDRSKSSFLPRSVSHKCSSSTKSPFMRSFSKKNSSNLPRSSSQNSTSTKSLSSSLPRSSSQRCSEFTRKCSNMAKEQKAKFYIVKRCIGMLVRWKKNSDS